MKMFTGYIFTLMLCFSVSAEQPGFSKKSLLAKSEFLASEMGRTFQLAKNCQQDMTNISPSSATIFFRNYFEEHDVDIIMKKYMLNVTKEEGKLCDREKIKFYVLMNKIAIFIRGVRLSINK